MLLLNLNPYPRQRYQNRQRGFLIGDYAFSGCSSLTSIYIPDGVTTIGFSAFSGCSSLTSIYIPSSVTSIESRAFSGCSILTIYCEDSSHKPSWSGWSSSWNSSNRPVIWNSYKGIHGSLNGLEYIVYHAKGDPYIVITGYNGSDADVVIPEYIEANGEQIAVKETIKSVTIPDGVTTIGSSAFEGCSSLTSIYIPDSVTTIGDYAFRDCSNLTICCEESSEPSAWGFWWNSSDRPVVWGCEGYGITVDGIHYVVLIDDENVKYITIIGYTGSSINVVIPSSINVDGEDMPVKAIASNAFYNNDTITSITIPDGVTKIGSSAFEGCSSLTSIHIPNSVTKIGSSAFEGCSTLTIYCEASSEPSGWSSLWNSSDRPVVWNCTYDEYLEAIA